MQFKNSKINKPTFVWFLNDENKFVRGNINNALDILKTSKTESKSCQLIPVHTSDGEILYKSAMQLYPADTEFGFSDNCSLLYLTIPNVAYNIKKRFKSVLKGDVYGIYTFTGSILIAVNPYRALPCLYDEKTLISYVGKTQNANPPHPFAIAEAAYRALLKHNKSQSIIISGESGSGKTECSKHVLRYLAYNSSHTKIDQEKYAIENRVLETNPVLEAFGNATTVRNVNSSRFGKLIKLHFDKDGHISRGSISTYLLAKSRVSKVPANERNYHIFYWLCLEATPEERKNLYIYNVEYYRFLDSDCSLSMPSNLEKVRKAMDVINSSKQVDQVDVFKTLSIILTLGNLEFIKGFRIGDSEENVTIISRFPQICSMSETSTSFGENPDSLDVLHQLFNFESPESQNTFELALTSKKICDTRCNLSIHQAKQNVNALARHLYQRLFNYLVSQINIMLDYNDTPNEQNYDDEVQQMQPKNTTGNFIEDSSKTLTTSEQDGAYVGVLDIFGFEDMLPYSCNGFEQLCINYANEQLHTFFLNQLIINDLKIYHSEGIQPPRNVSENCTVKSVSCCNAIYNCLPHGPPGVFQLLDEASLAPVVGHKDFYFCRKVNTSLGQRVKSASGSLIGGVILGKKNFDLDKEFLIRHYAGDVLYTAENFNFQNLDFLPQDLEISLRCCKNDFISKILFNKDNDYITEKNLQKNKCSRNSEVFSRKDNKSHATQNNPDNIKTSKSKTLSSVFCSQVKCFVGELEKTVSWFIRCVKPNERQNFSDWDEIRVRQQLENSGMIVALEWMVCGYPCRVSFEELWKRYGHLLPPVMRCAVTPDEFAKLVFLVIGTNSSDFQLGKSFAFFRLGSLYDIETLKDVARADERRIVAQRIYEFWLRKRLKRSFFVARCVIRISQILRDNRFFKLAKEAQQYYYTNFLTRRHKILVIQRGWRHYCIKKRLASIARCKISSLCLRWIHRRRFHKMLEHVSTLQAVACIILCRKKYYSCLTSIECIQSCVFTTIHRKKFCQNHKQECETKAVIFIQTWWKYKKRQELKTLRSGRRNRDVSTDQIIDANSNCNLILPCDNDISSVLMNDDKNYQMYNQECIVDQSLQKKGLSAFTQNTLCSQNVLYKSPATSSLTRKSLDYISNNYEKQFFCPCEKAVFDICDFTTKVSRESLTEQPYLKASVIQESCTSSPSNQKYKLLEIAPIVSECTPECRSTTNDLLNTQLHHTRSKNRTSTTTPTPSMTTPRYYQALLFNNSTDSHEYSDKNLSIINNFPIFDLQKPQVDANVSTTSSKTELRSSRKPKNNLNKSFIHLLESPTHNSQTSPCNFKNSLDPFMRERHNLKNTPSILSCVPEPNGRTSEDSFKMFVKSSTINTSTLGNTSDIFSASVVSTNKTSKNTPKICFSSPSINSSTSKTSLNTFSQSPLTSNKTSGKLLRIFTKLATPSSNSKSILKQLSNSPAQSLEIPQEKYTVLCDTTEENINARKRNPNLLFKSTQNRLSISETLVVSLESPRQRMTLPQASSDVLPESPQPSQPLPLPRSSLVLLNNKLNQLDILESPTKNKEGLRFIPTCGGFSNDEYPLVKNRVSKTNTTYINGFSKQPFFTEESSKTFDNFSKNFFKRKQDSTKRRWSLLSEVCIPSNDSFNAKESIIEHKRKKLSSHPTVLRRSRSDSSTFLNLDSQSFHVNNTLSNLIEYHGDIKRSYTDTKYSKSPVYLPELGPRSNLLEHTLTHGAPKELNTRIKSSPSYKRQQCLSLEKTQLPQNAMAHVVKENSQCFNHNQICFDTSLLDCKEKNRNETHDLTKEKNSSFFYPYDNKPENLITDYMDTKRDKRDGLRTTETSESSSQLHVISKADFHESPMSLNSNLLKIKKESNRDSKTSISPVLSMPQYETKPLEDNDTLSLNSQSKNYPWQSPKKNQIYPDPRRVSWLFMEGSLLEGITAKSSTTPISIQKSFKNDLSGACSEKRDCSVICPEEDMASPLLSYQTALPNPATVNSSIENSHLPLRRSIIITDEILFANEGSKKISKPDILPSNTLVPFPNPLETFEKPSLLKPNPSATMIFPKSRIPRLRRRKRVFHQQSTSEEVETSGLNFTKENLVKNSNCSLTRFEIPSNNFFFTSANACQESKFIHTKVLAPPKTFYSGSSTRTADVTRTQTIDKVPTFSQNKLSRYREDTSKSYCASSKLPRLM